MAFRRLFAVAVVSVLGILPACQGGSSGFGTPAKPGKVDSLDVAHAGLKQRWTHTIGLSNGENITKAWRVGDAIYVTTSKSFLVALDASSGVRRWELDMGTAAREIYRPVEVPGMKAVIISSKGEIAALDKASGKVIARESLGFTATTDPFVIDNTLCVGGPSYYYGLYLDPFGGQKWKTSAPGDYFIGRPAQIGTGSIVIVSGKEGKLWRINPADGQWDWRDRKVSGPVIAPLAVDARYVYVASLDNRLYAFDQATSAHVWDTHLEGRLELGPVPANPATVLCPTSKGGLYALSTDKGTIRWTVEGAEKVGTVVGDRVYVLNNNAQLLALSLETGETLSSLALPGSHTTVTNKTDALVFVTFYDGRIVAFEQNR